MREYLILLALFVGLTLTLPTSGEMADSLQPPTPSEFKPNAKNQQPAEAGNNQSADKGVTAAARISPAPEQQDNRNNISEHANSYSPNSWWAIVLSVIGLVISALTLVLFWRQTGIIGQQADLMDRQNIIMEGQTAIMTSSLEETKTATKNSQLGLRAYVKVEDIQTGDGTNGLNGPTVAYIVIVFRNVGQTQAHDFISHADLAIGPNNFKENFMQPIVQGEITIVLEPGKAIDGYIKLRDLRTNTYRPITPEEKQAISNGEKFVYLQGEFRYRDAFGNPRFHKYRMRNFSGSLTKMGFCTEGNESE